MEKEEIFRKIESTGFFEHNAYHIIDASEEEATIRVEINEHALNPYGMVHGGIIFGLGDNAMGLVASASGRNAVTLNAAINFLKPGKGSYLIGKAKKIKKGKTTCYVQTNIYNEKEELIATMDGNYYYIN